MKKILLSVGLMAMYAGLPGLAQADVYKWTDRSGHVVYSDQPPTGVKAQLVSVTDTHATVASAPVGNQKKSGSLSSDIDAINAKIDAESAKTKAANQKIKETNCQSAKNRLASLQQMGRIVVPGSNALATDTQRQNMIKEAQDSVQQWCN